MVSDRSQNILHSVFEKVFKFIQKVVDTIKHKLKLTKAEKDKAYKQAFDDRGCVPMNGNGASSAPISGL